MNLEDLLTQEFNYLTSADFDRKTIEALSQFLTLAVSQNMQNVNGNNINFQLKPVWDSLKVEEKSVLEKNFKKKDLVYFSLLYFFGLLLIQAATNAVQMAEGTVKKTEDNKTESNLKE